MILNISDIDKAQLLLALYNYADVQGLGFLDPNYDGKFSIEDAQKMIDRGQEWFDYVHG